MTDPDAPNPGPISGPPRVVVRRPVRPRREDKDVGLGAWLTDPRGLVLVALGSALIVGGGRRWLQVARARRAVAALGEPHPDPAVIRAAADHGRAGLMDLFRLLDTAPDPAARDAAGQALARLWHRDDLIVEEEKALVRRGFVATWYARRRYPRGLHAPIPVVVRYGVPFLRDHQPGEVGPDALSWSHRITGAERVGLEQPSTPIPGPGLADFRINPNDYPTNGPHRLVLHARVHASGPTSAWDLDLPLIPFPFEFDPRLSVDALLAPVDDGEAARIGAAVRLILVSDDVATKSPRWLDLNTELVLRDTPALEITGPIPRDLAHSVAIEFEGIPGRFHAGTVVARNDELTGSMLQVPLGPIAPVPTDAIERPGPVRLRVTLTPDVELAWADPAVRSLWPGELTTEWIAGRVVRR